MAGICFGEKGHLVTCVNIDENKINEKGISPIYEANLETLMRKNYEAGKINYTTAYKRAYKNAHAIFIGIGTPEQSDGSANLSYIAKLAREIAESIEKDCLGW